MPLIGLEGELQRKYDWAKSVRQQYERQWLTNIAFYQGNQWLYYDKMTRQLVDAKRFMPSHKVALVINLVRPVLRTELAKLTKQKPVYNVVANTPDFDDKDQARIENYVLDHIWRKLKLDQVFSEALLWAILTGTGYVMTTWDADAGDVVVDYRQQIDEFGRPMVDDEGNPVPVIDSNGEPVVENVFSIGELNVEVPGSFEVYLDPLAKRPSDVGWFFRERVVDADEASYKYNTKISPESVTVIGASLEGNVLGSQKLEGRNVCILREFWQKPSLQYPLGRYIITTGNWRVIYSGENPYADSGVDLPLSVITHIPNPGRVYGDSVATDLVPIQTAYNKTRSQIVEVQNLMAWPKVLAAKGSLDTEPTSRAGEIVEYNGSLPAPSFWTPPGIPAYVVRELDRAWQEMIEVSGVHEATRGSVPANVRSGIAIAYVQEQDETRLVLTAHSYEAAIEDTCTKILRIARKYYVEPRTIRIVGPDRATKVAQFYGKDIPADADVHVVAGSSLPKSVIARQQFILDMWNARLIQDPAVAMRLLEFGNVEELYEDADLDISQAERENEAMAAGAPAVVEDFHNHTLHILQHNRFRKSERYDGLPQEIKQAFAAHVFQHMSMGGQLGVQPVAAQGTLGGLDLQSRVQRQALAQQLGIAAAQQGRVENIGQQERNLAKNRI